MATTNSAMRSWFWLAGALAVTAMFKLWLLLGDSISFNSDEAVVALMARHTLDGAPPVFFYGQAYMGSLDAWLVAAGFALFGEQVWVIRLVQSLLYLGTVGTTALLGQRVFQSFPRGILAAWLLAIPTVNVTLYTTASLGGYGEALLLGNLILLWTLRIDSRSRHNRISHLDWFLWGFLAGFGVWVFGLTLVYSLPAGVYLLWSCRDYPRKVLMLALIALGGIAGASPWFIYAIQNGFERLLLELSGGAIAGVEGLPYLQQVWQHLVNLVLFGSMVTLGLRPPWGITWLALPLLPFVMIFWIIVLLQLVRRLTQSRIKPEVFLLVGVVLAQTLAFILTPFGADPSGRYFLPLAAPLALFAADWIISLRENPPKGMPQVATWLLVLLIIGYQLWGTTQCVRTNPPGLTTQFDRVTQIDHRHMPELIAFLRQRGETTGYTNYWVAYPLAFLSSEELLFVPRLPYHPDGRYTPRDDRYAPYSQQVTGASKVAYITTRNPALDAHLEGSFQDLEIEWQDTWIGDYHIFYNLSAAVRPEQIGLGETSQ